MRKILLLLTLFTATIAQSQFLINSYLYEDVAAEPDPILIDILGAWDFESNTTVLDLVGAVDGADFNSPTLETGRHGNAVGVSGANNSYINFGDPSGYSSLGAITVFIDIYPTAAGESSTSNIFGNFYLETGSHVWSLGFNSSSKVRGRIADATSNKDIISTNTYALNTWHRIALRWQGTGNAPEIFINGVDEYTGGTTTGAMRAAGADLCISTDQNFAGANNRQFTGRVDNAFVWDRALTDAEMAQMFTDTPTYAELLAPPTIPTDPVLAVSPLFFLTPASIDPAVITDGSTITTWEDVSGNGLDATSTGTNVLNIGSSGRQVQFNGSSWWDIPDDASLDFNIGTDDFTLIAREGDVGAIESGYLISKAEASATNREYGLYYDNTVQMGLYLGGTQVAGFIPIVESSKRLFIVVFTGSAFEFYSDGVLIDSGTLGANQGIASQSVNIGGRTDGSYLMTAGGQMDLAAIIPSALTTEQRVAIENEYILNTAPIIPTPADLASLVFWMDAEEQDGIDGSAITTITDQKGNAVTITPNNVNLNISATGAKEFDFSDTGDRYIKVDDFPETEFTAVGDEYTVLFVVGSMPNTVPHSGAAFVAKNDKGVANTTADFAIYGKQADNLSNYVETRTRGGLMSLGGSPNAYTVENSLIAVTVSANNVREIFYNGVSQSTSDQTDGSWDGDDWYFGAQHNSVSGFIDQTDGSVKAYGIYNDVLTAAQLLAIYEHYVAIPIDNLVSYWTFEDNGNDVAGTNNGTVTGATYGASGVIGKFLDCDGSADYLQVPDDNSLSFTTGSPDAPFSMSGWYKFDNTDDASIVWSKRANEYQLGWGGTTLQWYMYSAQSSSNYLQTDVTWTPTIGQWYHIAVAYNGGGAYDDVTIYIDGVAQTISNSSVGTYTGMTNSSADLAMGVYLPIPTNIASLDGGIDNVALWDKELSAAEVQAIYDKENGGTNLTN